MNQKSSPFVLANTHHRLQNPMIKRGNRTKNNKKLNKYCQKLKEYKIFKFLKMSSYGCRPKKMRLKTLNEIIEQLYSERYEIEMQNIRACMNRIVEEDDVPKEIRDFNEYIYDFLKRRYHGSVKKTEETILNILKTIEVYKSQERHLQLFCDFLNEKLTPEDISCFLLIRSLIEKELKVCIFNKNTKKILDLNFIALTKKQTRRIISRFLGEEQKKTVETVIQKFIFEHKGTYNNDLVKIYDLMIYGVKEYKNLRENKRNSNNFSNRSYIDSCCYQTFSPFSKQASVMNNSSLKGDSEHMSELDSRQTSNPLRPLDYNLFHGAGNNQTSRRNLEQNLRSLKNNDYLKKSSYQQKPVTQKENVPHSHQRAGMNKPHQQYQNGYQNHNQQDNSETASFCRESFNPHHTFNYNNKQNFSFKHNPKEELNDEENEELESDSQREILDSENKELSQGSFSSSSQRIVLEGASYSREAMESLQSRGIKEDGGGVYQMSLHHQSIRSTNKDSRQSRRYDTVENFSMICFTTLKSIIKEFVVDVMSQEEIESEYDQNVIEEISGIIYHKAKILLKAITRRDKKKWFSQLMIITPTPAQSHYIDQVLVKFDHILGIYRSAGQVDREKTQELSKFILSAPEMTTQISKLIAHIVASFEGGLDEGEEEEGEEEDQLPQESSMREVMHEQDETYKIEEDDSMMKTSERSPLPQKDSSSLIDSTERDHLDPEYESYDGDEEEHEIVIPSVDNHNSHVQNANLDGDFLMGGFNVDHSSHRMDDIEQELMDSLNGIKLDSMN